MVYKSVSGIQGNVANIWSSKGSVNEERDDVLNTNNFFKGHYKNRIVDEWRVYKPKEVNSIVILMHNNNNNNNIAVSFLIA